MARPRPGKKREPDTDGQLPLPSAPAATRLLPMQLKIGDRFTDETGDWEVVGRPYTIAGGKNATHDRHRHRAVS